LRGRRGGGAVVIDAAAGAAHVAGPRGEVGILVRPRAPRRRALSEELLLQLGVPVVLDVVVCSPRQLRCNDGPPEHMNNEQQEISQYNMPCLCIWDMMYRVAFFEKN